MKATNIIALIFIIIGALNWGLWGFAKFDLIASLFGGNASVISRLIYAIIGLSGLWSLRFLGRCKVLCSSPCSTPKE